MASPTRAVTNYGDDNPFVEAMLRMMEIFGLIDRNTLSRGVPYLPGNAGIAGLGSAYPGMGMMPGMSPLSGWGGMPGTTMPGMSPLSGWGGMPGTTMPGMSTIPGMSTMQTAPLMGAPGSMWGNYGNPLQQTMPLAQGLGTPQVQDLDGVWELSNGSVAIIKRSAARLFVSREKYQDFVIGYDAKNLWWTPRGGNTTTTYRYQVRDGRMVLRDDQGKVLMMRRRK